MNWQVETTTLLIRGMRRLIADVRAHFLARWPSFFQGRVVADWGQVGKLYVFCAVLAYSRVRFVRFSDNLGQVATLEALAAGFESLGRPPSAQPLLSHDRWKRSGRYGPPGNNALHLYALIRPLPR